jgi:transposase
MWIIGCDFHPRYQQVAALNRATGELVERRLSHEEKEAETFYEALPPGALVGMEATCAARWFERLLDRCGHQFWVGHPAQIRASAVRKQKTDARDAQQLLELLARGEFPRIWVPTPAERDARQLLLHRHELPTVNFLL